MKDSLTIAMAQCNFTVGDLAGNQAKILQVWQDAAEQGADLTVFPECCVTGYPPEDLVLKPQFQKQAMESVEVLAKATAGKEGAMLIGSPWVEDGEIYNAAFILEGGEIKAQQYKYDLPNYGVFDEKRVFSAGPLPNPVDFHGAKLGLYICEDMWNVKTNLPFKDADILISMNGSPFEVAKHDQRMNRALSQVKDLGKPVMYVNQLCALDDLVFDGDSFVLSHEGEERIRLSRTAEALELTHWSKEGEHWVCEKGSHTEYATSEQVMYQAMMLGLREYVEKNGFTGVLIGLSGGVDSALTAAVAVDALGPDKVKLIMMPSRYTSEESLNDAAACAGALGAKLETLSIEPMFEAYEAALAPVFEGYEPDIAEENLQSRIRGALLMAMSNKFGDMVVATGNKSEMAVGYATLYGDMCGGYSMLKDAYKMQVFALSRWRNANVPEGGLGPAGEVIPENIITKAPTAELRPNQKDEDSLPPYDLLDQVLQKLIEERQSVAEIVAEGFEAGLVKKVAALLYRAEYKRRQSPPGVKISARPFSRDRRYPITNKFCE